MANADAPATAKGRATRERILQAAAELIAEKGPAGMSLDDVRVRTGASRSQLYHYFEDRDDLVHAVIDVTIDAGLDPQGDLLDHLDSWASIDRWFDSLVQHQIGRQPCGGCPLRSAARQHPADAAEPPAGDAPGPHARAAALGAGATRHRQASQGPAPLLLRLNRDGHLVGHRQSQPRRHRRVPVAPSPPTPVPARLTGSSSWVDAPAGRLGSSRATLPVA